MTEQFGIINNVAEVTSLNLPRLIWPSIISPADKDTYDNFRKGVPSLWVNAIMASARVDVMKAGYLTVKGLIYNKDICYEVLGGNLKQLPDGDIKIYKSMQVTNIEVIPHKSQHTLEDVVKSLRKTVAEQTELESLQVVNFGVPNASISLRVTLTLSRSFMHVEGTCPNVLFALPLYVAAVAYFSGEVQTNVINVVNGEIPTYAFDFKTIGAEPEDTAETVRNDVSTKQEVSYDNPLMAAAKMNA